MNAKLYGPREEVLVDQDSKKAHLANLTRAVLMLLAHHSALLDAHLRDGATPAVRAHLQEQSEAVGELLAQLMAGASALGFIDFGSEDGVPR